MDNVARLTKQQYKHYYNNNDDALDAFLARKDAGMGLSDRVWNYTDNFMELAEKGIEYGIRTGADAPTMARDLKDYLKFPDKLFRRVRDADGELHLSEAAKAFHPGQGVYRSSYANAMRLARTEINMAYRTADYERYQQLDFVVGIKVTLSNNHTCKGVKGIFVDICDELQGEYPKDFKFVGWHPQCRCHVESILSNEDELKQNLKDILQGKDTELQSDNKVTELPDNFKNWLENNADRIERAKSLPYFLRDNANILSDGVSINAMGLRGSSVLSSRESTKKGKNAYNSYDSTPHLDKDIRNNAVKMQQMFNDSAEVNPRDFWDADDGLPNPKNGNKNCVNATLANEALRRGINVVATDTYVEAIAKDNIHSMFLNKKGKPVQMSRISGKGEEDVAKKIMSELSAANGRYIIAYNNRYSVMQYKLKRITKDKIEGHIISAEMTPNGLVLYDHQDNCFVSLQSMLLDADIAGSVEYMRVDNKLFNLKSPHIKELFAPI